MLFEQFDKVVKVAVRELSRLTLHAVDLCVVEAPELFRRHPEKCFRLDTDIKDRNLVDAAPFDVVGYFFLPFPGAAFGRTTGKNAVVTASMYCDALSLDMISTYMSSSDAGAPSVRSI